MADSVARVVPFPDPAPLPPATAGQPAGAEFVAESAPQRAANQTATDAEGAAVAALLANPAYWYAIDAELADAALVAAIRRIAALDIVSTRPCRLSAHESAAGCESVYRDSTPERASK